MGWRWGETQGSRSFPSPLQALETSLPRPLPFRTKLFPPSPPCQPPAAPTSAGARSKPRILPGMRVGRLRPQGRKGGAAWLEPWGPWGGRQEGAGQEPEQRELGARTSASFTQVGGRRSQGHLSPLWESREGEGGQCTLGQTERTRFLELQGYSYAKDLDAVVFPLFSNYYYFFVPNFEVGSGPPGEHGLSQGGAAEPRSCAGPSSLAPTLVPTGVHRLEASRCGLRPAPSRIEAGAATWTGGDWGGPGAPLA